MYFALGLVFLSVSIVVHELAHAIAMVHNGIKISEIGFGVKIPHIPNLSWKSKWLFPGAKIVINHIPLLAYVKPVNEEENDVRNLEIPNQAVIYGAGVMSNIIFFSVLSIFAVIANIFSVGRFNFLVLEHYRFSEISVIVILLCLCGLIFIFRRFFCEYLIPLIGMAMLILVIYSITQDPKESVGGPVAVGAEIKKNSYDLYSTILFSGFISLSLALLNMLPLYPLDGGQIVAAKLEKTESFFSGYYELIGGLAVLVLVVTSLGSDVFRIINYFKGG